VSRPNEVYVDHDAGIFVLNDSGVETSSVLGAMRRHPEIAALEMWSRSTRGPADASRATSSLFDRDRFVTPANPYDQMRVCYDAESDDVVGGWLDTTEAQAFSRLVLESPDEDEQNVLNQIAEDMGLLTRMKELWREDSLVSNAYIAVWWGRRDYKVDGKTDAGNAKRKTFSDIQVPVAMSMLDPLKVLPLGNFLFGREQLCYIANWAETDPIDAYLNGDAAPTEDPVIARLILGKYRPSMNDRKMCAQLAVDPNRLYELNPNVVFRHSATRSSYQQFATRRLVSVLELLDLKHQLRQRDRATLIGGTNFIVLIKKGSDNLPGQPDEVAALQSQVRVLSQVPVIVGDQRLNIEIVTPSQDHTLDPERYLGLDARIQARLFGMFTLPGTKGGDDSLKLARVIARGLEARRDAQRVTVRDRIIREIRKRNPEQFTEKPDMRYFPRRIALDFDPALVQFILDLMNNGKLSDESALAEVDFDVWEEARRKKREKDKGITDLMTPALPPPGSPAPAGKQAAPAAKVDPKAAGRQQGGRRAGGGAAPGSGQGKAPVRGRPKTAKTGTEKPTRQAASEDEGDDVE
jgi:hypothetical protein